MLPFLILSAGLAGTAQADIIPKPPYWAEIKNRKSEEILTLIWLSTILAFFFYKLSRDHLHFLRTMTGVFDDKQYFAMRPISSIAWFKQHLFSAPLFRHQKSNHLYLKIRKFRLRIGAMPARMPTIMISAYIILNIILNVTLIDFSLPTPTLGRIVCSRAGNLSTINMIPLLVMVGRNNPFMRLLDVSYDTFILCHRWIGRLVVFQAAVHVLAFVLDWHYYIPDGAHIVLYVVTKDRLFVSGLIGMVGFAGLLVFSIAAFRSRFYEIFLHIHQISALVGIGGTYYHIVACQSWTVVLIAAAVAALCWERLLRLVRLAWYNLSLTGTTRITRCDLTALPGDVVRVDVRLARPWVPKPGEHAYLYIPSISRHMNHPFSVAWGRNECPQVMSSAWANSTSASVDSAMTKVGVDDEVVKVKDTFLDDDDASFKLPKVEMPSAGTNDLVFLVKRNGGFTDQLYQRAMATRDRQLKDVVALVEGPYSSEDLSSYGTVLLIASGVGITHQLLQVKHLLQGYEAGVSAIRRINLVWIVQHDEHVSWAQQELTEILEMEHRREILRLRIYVTRPDSNTKAIQSLTGSVQLILRRPKINDVIDESLGPDDGTSDLSGPGAACVSICGNGALGDDARLATRKWMAKREVDFHEACFSW